MIELAARIPISLSRGQTLVVLLAAAGLVAALLAGSLFEGAMGGIVSVILRLLGHRPPRKSSFGTALDELQARLDRKDK
jgi:hypothetical protein